MSRPRTAAIAAALLAGTALLTGCGSGFGAQTSKAYAPADGVMGESGPVKVLNALVVAPEDGTEGVVSMTVVNRGTGSERLTGLTSDKGTVELTGDRTLAPGKAVAFTAGSRLSATIRDLQAKPGEEIGLELTFAGTKPIRLRTLVVPAAGPYASITAAPEETPTPSPSVSPSATTSPTATGSPTGTPSASASPTPTTS